MEKAEALDKFEEFVDTTLKDAQGFLEILAMGEMAGAPKAVRREARKAADSLRRILGSMGIAPHRLPMVEEFEKAAGEARVILGEGGGLKQ